IVTSSSVGRRFHRFTIRAYLRLGSRLGLRWLRLWFSFWFRSSVPPVTRRFLVTRSGLCMFVMVFLVLLTMFLFSRLISRTGHFIRRQSWLSYRLVLGECQGTNSWRCRCSYY